jgi:hypothetical protein
LEIQKVTAPQKPIAEAIADVEITLRGLRLEVEGWRQHTGSAEHFMLIEIDRLIGILEEIKRRLPDE